MDFTHDGDSMGYRGGGDNALTGIMAGSMLNRKDNDYIWAVIIFAIIFIIAIIALAMFNKDRGYHRDGVGTDYAGLIAAMTAAKCADGGGYSHAGIDKLEIMQKLEASEDRARETQTQQKLDCVSKEFMNMGFGLSGQIHNNEKTNLENFAKLENQMGMTQMALTQLLQKENNRDIIQGVISQLTTGFPCAAKC